MPARSESKRARLDRWLAAQRPPIIDSAVLAELRAALAPVSDSYLHDLVRNCGFAMSPEVEGVNAHTLEDLERTLIALAGLYEAGSGDTRSLVIAAKNRLRWAQARSSDPARKALHDEMILWMLTWLENPCAFPVWVRLRRRALRSGPPEAASCS